MVGPHGWRGVVACGNILAWHGRHGDSDPGRWEPCALRTPHAHNTTLWLLPPPPPPPPVCAGVPRLYDLVQCQEEGLHLAFYYAFRDTVVAADLEQASRIAYGQDRRFRRVVTLKVGQCAGAAGACWGPGVQALPNPSSWLPACLPSAGSRRACPARARYSVAVPGPAWDDPYPPPFPLDPGRAR